MGVATTIVGLVMIFAGRTHGKLFGYRWYRFSSKEHQHEVVREIEDWLGHSRYYSAKLMVVAVEETGIIYDLHVVEPRSSGANDEFFKAMSAVHTLPSGVLRQA